jgi:hypothetical protein
MTRQLDSSTGLRLPVCVVIGLLAAVIVAGPAPAQGFVINEVDYDQPGTDTAEFIELYNGTVGTIDLTLYQLVLINGNAGGSTSYATIPLTGNLAAGGYYVVCANNTTTVNCNLDTTPETNLVQNGAPDAVALVLVAGGAVVDTVSYEGDTAGGYTETSGGGLEDLTTGVLAKGISRFPNGVDTNVNNFDFSMRIITPGAENSPTVPVELMIFTAE